VQQGFFNAGLAGVFRFWEFDFLRGGGQVAFPVSILRLDGSNHIQPGAFGDQVEEAHSSFGLILGR
jgi:hypothetical protein